MDLFKDEDETMESSASVKSPLNNSREAVIWVNDGPEVILNEWTAKPSDQNLRMPETYACINIDSTRSSQTQQNDERNQISFTATSSCTEKTPSTTSEILKKEEAFGVATSAPIALELAKNPLPGLKESPEECAGTSEKIPSDQKSDGKKKGAKKRPKIDNNSDASSNQKAKQDAPSDNNQAVAATGFVNEAWLAGNSSGITVKDIIPSHLHNRKLNVGLARPKPAVAKINSLQLNVDRGGDQANTQPPTKKRGRPKK